MDVEAQVDLLTRTRVDELESITQRKEAEKNLINENLELRKQLAIYEEGVTEIEVELPPDWGGVKVSKKTAKAGKHALLALAAFGLLWGAYETCS